MSDHKKEAEQFLEDALDEYSREGGPIPGNVRDWLAIAQVNAALYLAEQQRIANLIALSQATDGNGWQAAAPLDALYEYDTELSEWPGGSGDSGLRIRAEIREGLGLA